MVETRKDDGIIKKSEVEHSCLPTGRRNLKSTIPVFTCFFWDAVGVESATAQASIKKRPDAGARTLKGR